MNLLALLQPWINTLGGEVRLLSGKPILVALVLGGVAAVALVRIWTIDARQRLEKRMAGLRDRVEMTDLTPVESPDGVPEWYRRIGELLAATPIVGDGDRARLGRLLQDAGIRNPSAVPTLIASKLIGAVGIGVVAWLLIEWRGIFASSDLIRGALLMGACLLGWRMPDFVVSHLGRRRRRRLDDTLADGVDLMVISVEAGLSLEQTINFVALEAKRAFPDIGEEFEITGAELRLLGDRREALQNLARRINLPSARSIVATLIQTMKYGTPLADSLRVLAAELRAARLIRIEERAARLPVLLTVPLMAFILPCTFMVVGGPAALQVIDSFKPIQATAPVNITAAAPIKG